MEIEALKWLVFGALGWRNSDVADVEYVSPFSLRFAWGGKLFQASTILTVEEVQGEDLIETNEARLIARLLQLCHELETYRNGTRTNSRAGEAACGGQPAHHA